jgi:hypothetical protein
MMAEGWAGGAGRGAGRLPGVVNGMVRLGGVGDVGQGRGALVTRGPRILLGLSIITTLHWRAQRSKLPLIHYAAKMLGV